MDALGNHAFFCHLSNAASCRDITNGLTSIAGNINHLGCKQAPSKSSVSYINKHRDHRLFEKFFYEVIDHLGQHVGFQNRNLKRLTRQMFMMDATVIPLCAKVFDWAKFLQYKGAVKYILFKINCLLSIRTFITFT